MECSPEDASREYADEQDFAAYVEAYVLAVQSGELARIFQMPPWGPVSYEYETVDVDGKKYKTQTIALEVATVQTDSIRPDVILMDVVMPEMNGFQATRKITRGKTTAHIPIIMISTKNQETDRVWGKRQGAKDYLVKPVEEKQLIDVIHQHLNT